MILRGIIKRLKLFKIGFFGQDGPKYRKDILQQTICMKLIRNIIRTKRIRGFIHPSQVKGLEYINDMQVTKTQSTWVITSETIRLFSIRKRREGLRTITEHSLYSLVASHYITLVLLSAALSYLPQREVQPARLQYSFLNYSYHSLISAEELKTITLYDCKGSVLQRCLNSSERFQLSCFKHSFASLSRRIASDFEEWLAGLIDGGGCFLLSKKGYGSLEITMDIRDEHCLNQIKQRYGGSIKLRSGSKSIRYRIHHKEGLIKLINGVNGLIRNPIRMEQLERVSKKYNIILIYPKELTRLNGWLAGLIDSDGSITINKRDNRLAISIIQKEQEDNILKIKEIYKGKVNIDKSKGISYKWEITKKEDILSIVEYLKTYPLRSGKLKRKHLITKYYELKSIGANKADKDSKLYKTWEGFIKEWEGK